LDKKLLRRILVVLVFVCSFMLPSFLALAQEIGSKEMLMFAEIPTVISAARKAQPITEAPAFVTVITAEDIRRSGATNIPDTLRMVPGLQVNILESGDPQVGIRGLTAGMSDKLLVMIDGRSVYLDFYNTVLWSTLEVTLDEIERIEVVEGPSSPLFGANAFSGVINIITKTPAEAKGTSLSVIGGQHNTAMTSLVHANVLEDIGLGYKITGSWNRANRWQPRELGAFTTGVGTALIEYKLGEDKKISLAGGHNEIDRMLLAAQGILAKGETGNLKLNYDQPGFYLHAYRNMIKTDFEYLGSEFHVQGVTYDTEAQKSLKLSENNSLILGANMRQISYNKTNIILKNKVSLDTWALYLQDEYKLSDNLTLFTGGRLDYDDISEKKYFSPRVAAVYTPKKDHVVRLSWGQAFRMPAIQEAFGDLVGLYPDPIPIYFPGKDSLTFLANPDIKPEIITTYELGYQGKLSDRAKIFGNLHYSKLKRMIDVIQFNYDFGFSPITEFAQYANSWHGDSYGSEVGLDYLLADWLTAALNYSYMHIRNDTLDRDHEVYPAHKINMGLRANWKNGFNADLNTFYVSGTKWHFNPYTDLGPAGDDVLIKTKPYVLTNLRLGYRFNKESMEFAVAVFNLFDKKHYQYPPEDITNYVSPGGALIRRNFTASFNYKF